MSLTSAKAAASNDDRRFGETTSESFVLVYEH